MRGITDSLPFRDRNCYCLRFSPRPALDLALTFETVSLSEFLYASCCVDEFLLPGKERVTVRTDIDMDVAHRGAGFRGITASTDNLGLLVLWMNAWFHTNLTIKCCLYHTKISSSNSRSAANRSLSRFRHRAT